MAVAIMQQAALMALLWWAVSEGRWDSAGFAAPVVLGAALAAVALRGARRWRLRPLAAVRVVPWFLGRALAAGFDVALRVLRPRLDIQPDFLSLRTTLADPGARVLLADAMSLMPGTLSAGLHDDELLLHVLDRTAPVERELRAIERRIAELLGPV